MARYSNGWYDYQMVRIRGRREIGQILEVDETSGSEPLYYVEGDQGTKKWYHGDQLDRCAQDKEVVDNE